MTHFAADLLWLISLQAVASLNTTLTLFKDPSQVDSDVMNEEDEAVFQSGLSESEADIRETRKKEEAFKKLFEGCKIFISREVWREPMVFIIRYHGGRGW